MVIIINLAMQNFNYFIDVVLWQSSILPGVNVERKHPKKEIKVIGFNMLLSYIKVVCCL